MSAPSDTPAAGASPAETSADQAIPNPKCHTIGEAARILGVSQRSLRFYEEAGLISPKVVTGSGYRYYSASDICIFREYREIRGLGLSLEEAKEFMLESDFERKARLLERREAELEREIAFKRFLLGWSAEQRRRYREVRSELGRLDLRVCPAQHRFDFESHSRFTAEDRHRPLIKRLQDAAPVVFTSVRVARAALEDQSLRCVFHRGLAFWSKDAALVPVELKPPLEPIGERQVIRLVSRTVKECRSAWMDDVAALCDREGLEVYDDILGAFYTGCRHGDKLERYYEFWVPVRPRP